MRYMPDTLARVIVLKFSDAVLQTDMCFGENFWGIALRTKIITFFDNGPFIYDVHQKTEFSDPLPPLSQNLQTKKKSFIFFYPPP